MVARWWKCQDAPNENCVPDLRIAFVPGGRIRPCHGIVTLGEKDLTPAEFIAVIGRTTTGMARIVLERDSSNIYHAAHLLSLADDIRRELPGIKLRLMAKKDMTMLEDHFPEGTKMVYYNHEPWRTDMGFWENVKRLWEMRRVTMRRFAGTSNKLIKPEYWSDEKKLYECDFI